MPKNREESYVSRTKDSCQNKRVRFNNNDNIKALEEYQAGFLTK